MSSSTGAVPSQLQLNWASSLDALLADLPDGWLKTQAQELRADADWPPEALPATIRCSGREFGAQWGEYELEAIGPHWAGRSATHLPERLTWPGCRFVRQLGSEQVVAVLQAWRQRSACPGAGVAVELRWRPLSGTRVSTEGLGACEGLDDADRALQAARGCVELLKQLPLAPPLGSHAGYDLTTWRELVEGIIRLQRLGLPWHIIARRYPHDEATLRAWVEEYQHRRP